MKNPLLLLAAWVIGLAAVSAPAADKLPDTSRMNVLFIIAEDWSANPGQPWKKAVFMVENESSQVVRNRKYSYLEFMKGPVPAALFDLEKDPWETVNLADDPAYAEVRQEMADSLQAGWKAALPPRTATTSESKEQP